MQAGIQYILTDIEGTTTDIKFVHQVLFPYSHERISDFVIDHSFEHEVNVCVEFTRSTLVEEGMPDPTGEDIIDALLRWIKEDRKHPALKHLQGLIWREGYLNGDFKGHVYPDVPPVLEKWQQSGLTMGIYSSGSEEAQRLLFGHSDFGDLKPFFSDYFDTEMGPKREVQSYHNIVNRLGIPAEAILFLSDVEAELDAAQAAGMATLQLLREGTVASEKHQRVGSFAEI
jgi:enolase-phosphatase E1